MNADEIVIQLSRTADQTFSKEELLKKLENGRPLRIKFGVDVTAPFLHIGHAVNLWMMRQLQEQGHKVILLIGDFTTRIGDPTGKSQVRKIISREDIEANAERFIEQVGAVLLTDSNVFEVRRNSEWFDAMPMDEFLSLLSMVTHARLIERDMFQKRIMEGQEIRIHEMIYPIIQGYDSVMLESDLTIVGSDQLFNELMGRFFQEKFGQEPQIVMTSRITPGLDGGEKQSKSLGNYVALADSPRDKFGKTMRLPDNLIIEWLEVYTTLPVEEIAKYGEALASGTNPMELKRLLASAVVERYHGLQAAEDEAVWFTDTFSKRETPEDAESVEIPRGLTVLEVVGLCLTGFSRGAIRELIAAGAVSLEGAKLADPGKTLEDPKGLLKIGKRRWFNLNSRS